MLNIEKKGSDKNTVYFLSGAINESAEFRGLFGDIPQSAVVNCKGISRINSVGVKGWIKFFGALKEEGKIITFEELSVCLVEQANNVRNFLCGFSVKSLCTPYMCDDDSETCIHVFTVDELKQCNFDPPDLKCGNSSGNCTFDDIPDQYFVFLKRS